MKARVLVITFDKTVVRSIKARAIKEHGLDPVFVPDIAQAIEHVTRMQVDLIALSTSIDYMQAMPYLRAATSAPIIVYSHAYSYDEHIATTRQGADLYIEMRSNMNENVSLALLILQRHLDRMATLDHNGSFLLHRDVFLYPAGRVGKVFIRNEAVELMPKEYDVLRVFMSTPNVTLSSPDILRAVWGDGYMESDITALWPVIARLRYKLKKHASKAHIKTLRNVGYILE